jgi:uncharacterized protein YuzE
MKPKCKQIHIPKNVCHIKFVSALVHHSDIKDITARGETIIFDYDKNNYVIGIELLSNDKPCQRSFIEAVNITDPKKTPFCHFAKKHKYKKLK